MGKEAMDDKVRLEKLAQYFHDKADDVQEADDESSDNKLDPCWTGGCRKPTTGDIFCPDCLRLIARTLDPSFIAAVRGMEKAAQGVFDDVNRLPMTTEALIDLDKALAELRKHLGKRKKEEDDGCSI